MDALPILARLQDTDEPTLTSEHLKRLELELDVYFPHDYAEFLLHFNGGYFVHPVRCYVPNVHCWPDGVSINAVYGDPGDNSEGVSLRWCAGWFVNELPQGLLAIAASNGLGEILLSVDRLQPEFGKVWLWDRTWEAEGGNIHLLAESFNDFLAVLQHNPYFESKERESIPIFQVIERGNQQRVEEFLSQGGDIESRNADGRTLLTATVVYRWPKIVGLLLERGADANARDHKGRTPLHHAAMHSVDGAKLLLAAGADAKARDHDSKSVLAGWSYRLDQLLRAHGAEE